MDDKDKELVQSIVTEALKASATETKKLVEGAITPMAESIKSLTDNQKVLADTLEKLPPASAVPTQKKDAKGDDEKPLSRSELASLLDERETKRRQADDVATRKQDFIAKNLAKLPDVYKKQLGDNPDKWGDESKAIQTTFESDLKSRGVKLETLGGASHEGGVTAANLPIDMSKMTPVQKIALGLKNSPIPGIVASADNTAATTQAAVVAK